MFLHVDENVPAEPEHPTQGAAALRKLVGTAFAGCAAFAGAIDKIATARPATNSEAAFMAISSLIIPGQQIPSRSVMRAGDHTADRVLPPSQNRPLPFSN
jgi:hypothetical protein